MGSKHDLNILVIEDDLVSFRVIEKLLSAHFERVHHATTGAEGLKVYGSIKPDIIFVDVNLPDMSGVEVTRAICAEDPLALVAIVTGVDANEKQVVIDSLKAGASEYLHKPVKEAEIKSLSYRLLGILNRRRSKTFYPDTLQSAHFKFSLQSDGRALPPTVQYLRTLLSGYLPDRDVMRLALGLDEVLRNAYEHGNLGITSEEKKKSCDEGTFEQLLLNRQHAAKKVGKEIAVEIKLSKNLLECVVADEGPGFEWRAAVKSTAESTTSTDLHGRGVLAINKIFDEVRYNDKGNVVTLIKRLA